MKKSEDPRSRSEDAPVKSVAADQLFTGSSQRRDRTRERRREAVRMADLTTVGLVFPIAIVIGFLGGRFVGGWFGAADLGGWMGGGLGIVSGFYNVFKTARMLARQDQIPGAAQEARDRDRG